MRIYTDVCVLVIVIINVTPCIRLSVWFVFLDKLCGFTEQLLSRNSKVQGCEIQDFMRENLGEKLFTFRKTKI